MGYVDLGTLGATKFPGGETEALRRLHEKVSSAERHAWVCRFEKPNTAPNSLEPSTTVSTEVVTLFFYCVWSSRSFSCRCYPRT
jgi:cryptochrome